MMNAKQEPISSITVTSRGSGYPATDVQVSPRLLQTPGVQMTNDAPPLAREQLSGYQVAQVQKQIEQTFRRAIDDIELRKIALEAAAAIYQGQLAQISTTLIQPSDPVALARELHAFLAEPAREIVITTK